MWKLVVPTYLGSQNARNADHPPSLDFGHPYAPVLICEAAGIRLILGAHDSDDRSKPDVQIERWPHGWAVFLHPDAGDPVGCVYILDNGRTFLLPERLTADPIEIVDDIPSELDNP